MLIYDVSVPLSALTPTYPGDPGIEIKPWLSLADGDPANVSLIHFGAHSGTHVDAPAHFIEGAPHVESLAFDALIGAAQVIEVPPDAMVIEEDFVAKNVAADTERVLFKTRNSNFWSDHAGRFRSDYTYIEPGAARKLARDGIRLVGIDYLSVDRLK